MKPQQAVKAAIEHFEQFQEPGSFEDLFVECVERSQERDDVWAVTLSYMLKAFQPSSIPGPRRITIVRIDDSGEFVGMSSPHSGH